MRIFLLVGAFATTSLGQDADPLIQCRQWDDAFLSVFHIGVIVVGIATLLFTVLSGLTVRQRGWWSRRNSVRAVLIGLALFILSSAVLVVVPTFFLGGFPYSGVDPQYRACVGQSFGAAGLLGGAVGSGVAAYAQRLAMIVTLFVVVAFGAVLGWLVGRARVGLANRKVD